MKVKQITTYHAKGKAYIYEKEFPMKQEAQEETMTESNVVNLYPEFTFQTIEGFGCAMTESSAYLLSQMKEEIRNQALAEYFGKAGNHIRFIRVPIDSCDYSLEEYQAVKNPLEDPELRTFSIARDQKYIIPMLKKALEISREPISVLLSPWSPPYQWKTAPEFGKNDLESYGFLSEPILKREPQRCNGGSLKPEYYGSWAKYVVKYIKAYLEVGIPVTMLSLQNETVAATAWDSCVWTPEETKTYLRDYLYPELKKEGLDQRIGIYIWDHNKERMIEHVLEVLDEETMDMVKGIAFHWYSGDHFEAVDLMNRKFPDKSLFLTECCRLHSPGRNEEKTLCSSVNFESPDRVDYQDAVQYAHDMIGNLNAGMNGWIDWNLVVDEQGGPRHVPNGFTSGLIADERGNYKKTLMYYYIGHFSRYIFPGAQRIGYSKYADNLEITAIRNHDGNYVVIMLNRHHTDTGCFLRINGEIVRIDLPAETISTIVVA